MRHFKSIIMTLALGWAAPLAMADAPSGYYSSCEGASGQSLLTALSGVVSSHTTISYSGLWTLYATSDVRDNGTIWDMYSTKQYTYRTDQCGTYSRVGDCYNREHSFPKSWFNDASPMVSDAFHIYPTDGKVNGQRSNYPYGECAGGTVLPSSGSVKALGRLGKSTFPGYSGTVFEPDDQYKGDFARSYFYMAAAYNSQISGWDSDMLAGNRYPAFKPWAVDLLLKWHRQDPVSDKERNRNDVVYGRQHNRNPFIDHPELAEYIWGDKKSTPWSATADVEPELLLPVDGSTLDLGTTIAGVPRSASVTVKGVALPADVTLTASDGFSVSPATVSASAAAAGATVKVILNAEESDDYTGTLTVVSGGFKSTVRLHGVAMSTLPVGPVNAISENAFTATWSYVGDADARGQYTLDVMLDGVSLDEFPCSVDATDEAYLVENLEPSTTYTYVVRSAHTSSAPLAVTTLEPQPYIEFLFDGLLNFTAVTGQPSEVAELLVDVMNISTDINISVSAPFELSTDKAAWATALTISPDQDRIYMRMLGSRPGHYTTSITASAGSYTTDQAEASGTIVDEINFHEDFEVVDANASSYSPPQYTGTAAVWNFTNAGIWPGAGEAHEGNQGVRLGKNSDSKIEMAGEHLGGMGVIKFWAKRFNNDAEATVEVEYTVDNGQTWKSAGSANVDATSYRQYSFVANTPLPARMRLRQTKGARVNIDDIEISSFSGLVPDAVGDYHRWDAFCRDGRLVVEVNCDETLRVAVYDLEGNTVLGADVCGSSVEADLVPGIYIVAVDNFARRVLVKK